VGSNTSAEAVEQLRQAADDFRKTASKDALYLVFIGTFTLRQIVSSS
jgi:hypothetical protein